MFRWGFPERSEFWIWYNDEFGILGDFDKLRCGNVLSSMQCSVVRGGDWSCCFAMNIIIHTSASWTKQNSAIRRVQNSNSKPPKPARDMCPAPINVSWLGHKKHGVGIPTHQNLIVQACCSHTTPLFYCLPPKMLEERHIHMYGSLAFFQLWFNFWFGYDPWGNWGK